MLEVLQSRYNYLADDVPHLDILGPALFEEDGNMRSLVSNEPVGEQGDDEQVDES